MALDMTTPSSVSASPCHFDTVEDDTGVFFLLCMECEKWHSLIDARTRRTIRYATRRAAGRVAAGLNAASREVVTVC